ncbi:uncharacterized protein F4807DRAFT_458254 [Annulohypoxylon truncatum]|uniref:uncharacterized protein n=1 Tax=Annulohypoxylon truncatum TaxID=327061 RepID=UPI00200836BA|nr:uncharacterized protein F4807DRAFT_458254 [Annulohypoxylon truncatum]KAI1212052.1 hypothetical protein F4807DRAFT_458254 [Annulohypoxylon truncatum]
MSDTSHASQILSGDLPSHSKSSPAVNSSRPSLKKRFTSSWVKRRSDKDDEDGIRGPLGLRILHSSPEPLVDLIFVHGLRGGSIKTWRKDNDPLLDDSDWASTKPSILNVHDFGQTLLEEMRNSPHLRKNPGAFILARDVSDFRGRIKCIFFLATPHRGSD